MVVSFYGMTPYFDVRETHADASLLKALTGFTPGVSVEQGVAAFVEWYRKDYARL